MKTRTDELLAGMKALDSRFSAGEIGRYDRDMAFMPLNDEYKKITGSYYLSSRYVVNSLGLSVHHDRAYLHQRKG